MFPLIWTPCPPVMLCDSPPFAPKSLNQDITPQAISVVSFEPSQGDILFCTTLPNHQLLYIIFFAPIGLNPPPPLGGPRQQSRLGNFGSARCLFLRSPVPSPRRSFDDGAAHREPCGRHPRGRSGGPLRGVRWHAADSVAMFCTLHQIMSLENAALLTNL